MLPDNQAKTRGVEEFVFFISFKMYDYFNEENAFLRFINLQISNQNYPIPIFRERCQKDMTMLIAFSPLISARKRSCLVNLGTSGNRAIFGKPNSFYFNEYTVVKYNS